MHFKLSTAVAAASIAGSAYSQQIAQDQGFGGMPIELVHLYHDEYPQGIPNSSDEEYIRFWLGDRLMVMYRYRRFFHGTQILKLCALTGPKQHQIHRCRIERK